jgi:parallel beta-helix repeat protein
MARTLALLFLASLIGGAMPAAAETVNCTAITTLPAAIWSPGIYCLTGDLNTSMTSGAAIYINASSVTLDLNGHKLGGLGAGPTTQAVGIYATDRKNITIRNGSIRGFYFGIYVSDNGHSSGNLVEQIRADGNTHTALFVVGTGSIVRNNQVVNTGGSTANPAHPFGVQAAGAGIRVLENDIIDTSGTGSNTGSFGVDVDFASGGVVRGNRISNTTRDPSGTSYGIFVNGSANVFVVDNVIENTTDGVYYNNSSGKYRDNLTSAVDTPYTNGTDAGNNQ